VGVRRRGQPGQTSELFDSPEGYFLARLDSIVPGRRAAARGRRRGRSAATCAKEKKLDRLVQQGAQLATRAKAGTLEAAAQAAGAPGAADGSSSPRQRRAAARPVQRGDRRGVRAARSGAVSAPVRTADGVYVMRVDRRTEAARQAFEAQKAEQRRQITGALRNERVRDFIDDLRKSAEIDDRRREVLASGRQQAAG
jgi:peptidyl-prolyl cis-trans isomerase D